MRLPHPYDRFSGRHWLVGVALLLFAESGCYEAPAQSCPGQREFCDDHGCVCGAICSRLDTSCPADEVCTNIGGPDGFGVCVAAERADPPIVPDPAVVELLSPDCPEACAAAGEFCVASLGVCATYCEDDVDCESGCCHELANNQLACLPAEYCEDGTSICDSCGPDDICVEDPLGRRCRPSCQLNADCEIGCCRMVGDDESACVEPVICALQGDPFCESCETFEICVRYTDGHLECEQRCENDEDCGGGCCRAPGDTADLWCLEPGHC